VDPPSGSERSSIWCPASFSPREPKRLGGMQIASAAHLRWGDAEKVPKYWSAKTTERLAKLKTRGALSDAPAGAESSR
jgi:hypothetical protein